MAETPGTWHDSDPRSKVAWHVAVHAWVRATEAILEDFKARKAGAAAPSDGPAPSSAY